MKDKEYLNSKKKLNIDETANNLNYCFAKNKPFFVINRIAKDAVPQGAVGNSGSKLGKSAGFLFYETYEGYYFQGIDTLFGQEPKIKVIYNNTPGSKIPENYDAKVLSYSKEGTPSLTTKLRAGFQNTKITQFNPFKMSYKVSSFSAEDIMDKEQTLRNITNRLIWKLLLGFNMMNIFLWLLDFSEMFIQNTAFKIF